MNRRALCLAVMFTALTALTASCGPRDRGLELKDAVRGYNERLRWNAFEQASLFVATEKRAAWLASRTANATGLHFTDIQVVRLQNPDAQGKTVEVLVALSWFRMPDTRVQSALWAQTWQELDGRWRLLDGAPVGVAPTPPPAQQWP